MHVAIRRYSADPTIFNDLMDKLNTDFVPQIKRIPGFSAYYAIKTSLETLATVSVFESEEGEKASNKLAIEFVKKNYPNMKVQRVTLDEGASIIELHAVHA
jgi:hypothetical protein